jgi:hypothetical protein
MRPGAYKLRWRGEPMPRGARACVAMLAGGAIAGAAWAVIARDAWGVWLAAPCVVLAVFVTGVSRPLLRR